MGESSLGLAVSDLLRLGLKSILSHSFPQMFACSVGKNIKIAFPS